MYLIGCVLVGLFVSYFGIEKYFEYSEKTQIVSASEQNLAQLDKDKKSDTETSVKILTENKSRNEAVNKALSSVFPSSENYTELTKAFDEYFLANNRTNNPIIVTDMTFGAPADDTTKKYQILPISMNITSSEPNFYKFLQFVQDSGTLSKSIRLLTLKSIQMNFSEEDASKEGRNALQFRADIDAYFQTDKS